MNLSEAQTLRWRRRRQKLAAATGDPLVVGLPEEFAGQLTVTINGCWRWHGQRRTDGRPMLNSTYVYRLLFIALRGPLKPSEILHHQKCRHYWCANPWHTEPMTQGHHMRTHGHVGDWLGQQSNKTHCPAGHPYDEANTDRCVPGERRCRECQRARGRQRYYADLEENRRKAKEKELRKRRRLGIVPKPIPATAELPLVFKPLRRTKRLREASK